MRLATKNIIFVAKILIEIAIAVASTKTVKAAAGSAYLELGNTKVMVAA